MSVDAFGVLAEQARRRILARLLTTESSVNALAEALGMSQPTVSKHLKVLREAGFVTCRTEAQRRIYRIEAGPFQALDDWLRPYRALWDRHLDALERRLGNLEQE